MAKNVVLPGTKAIDLVPAANVNSGDLVVVGQAFGVALTSGTSAAAIACEIGGTATLPKANAVSTSQAAGSNVHWDATNARTTISATSNLKIGVAAAGTTNTDVLVTVHLNPAF
jgi:predicted RecA/RadA family phage recombinase